MEGGTIEPTDLALLEAWRDGDRKAGNRLVTRHFPSVYRFLCRRVMDGVAAKDLAQRTFLALLESSARLDPSARMRAYVLGIANNLMLRHFRDAQRPAVSLGAEQSVVSPSRAVAQREEQSLVRTALANLPVDLRTTLELHYWDDLTTAEIGAVLGIAAGTAKWRLSRGRALLREEIASIAATAQVRESTLSRLDDWARAVAPASEDPT